MEPASASPNMANKPKDDVEDAANGAMNAAKDKVHQLKGRMEAVGSHIDDIACKASKEAGELASSVGSRVASAADTVKAEIHKNPVQSVVIALAVGIIGTLLFKRST